MESERYLELVSPVRWTRGCRLLILGISEGGGDGGLTLGEAMG